MNKFKYFFHIINRSYTTKFTSMQFKYFTMNIRCFSETQNKFPNCEKCTSKNDIKLTFRNDKMLVLFSSFE